MNVGTHMNTNEMPITDENALFCMLQSCIQLNSNVDDVNDKYRQKDHGWYKRNEHKTRLNYSVYY